MFYSTPACYLKAVNEWFSRNGTTMTSKKGQDFFPYAYNNNFLGGAHSYWSGFYTSKPAFKGLVRESSALLQVSFSMLTKFSILDKFFKFSIFDENYNFSQILQFLTNFSNFHKIFKFDKFFNLDEIFNF